MLCSLGEIAVQELIVYRDFALALAIGLLIGVERGWRQRAAEPGSRVAGIRTFGLIGAIGGAAGLMQGQAWAIPAALLAVAIVMAVGYAAHVRDETHASATTAIAGVLTACIGALATAGHPLPAAAAGVVAALLLSLRDELHGWLKSLTAVELESTLRFLLIAVVILPVLPNRNLGPYNALNPFEIGLAVVLLSGLSFIGYWAIRRFGPRLGLMLTAGLGGLISSTGATYALSERSRAAAQPPTVIAAGILLASTIMFVRVIILAGVTAPSLSARLMPTMVAAALAGLICAAIYWRRRSDDRDAKPLEQGNPLALKPALLFAAFLTVVMVAARWAVDNYGESGLFAVAAFTALADVDSVVLSVGKLARTEQHYDVLNAAICLAVAINTLVKAGIAVTLAERRAGLLATGGFTAMLVCGGIAFMLLGA
jgi:uncharacterized membrane protein (DUF4010 family)